jgi:putative ABC transport system permease protein
MATLKLLGETAGFDLLRIEVGGNRFSTELITKKAEALAQWLRQTGHPVHEIQVPPPGQHPHQSQMNAVLSIFILFSFMILILGSILVATAMATLMVKQVRHIGVMKTVGATSWQIGRLYLMMMLVICTLALTIGIPLSQLAASAFCAQMATLLNLEISDSTIPAWVILTQCSAGILIPLLATAVPMIRGSRVPVRQALDNHGVAGKGQRVSAFSVSISRASFLADTSKLALRNTFRQQTRLILTLTLLAAGGAIFMTAMNVSQAWDENLERLYVQRLYDQQVQLNEYIYADTLMEKINNLPGVKTVEGWDYAPTSVVKNNAYALTRTYPDKGHGSFVIQALPLPTQLLNPTVVEGRWLSTEGSHDVVLNQLARKAGTKIGDSIRLMIDAQVTTWTIVGFTEDVGSPAIAYVSLKTFAHLNGSGGKVRMLRMAYEDRSRESALAHNKSLEQLLEHEKISVSSTAPVWQLRNAVAAHMRVLINALLAMAVLMGVVGTLGLTSTMSMNMLERTREIGIMRAIGATPGKIRRLIAWEGVTIGALSIFVAFGLALPLSYALGRFIGYISFKTTLTLTVSAFALGSWATIVIAGSYLATVFPARRANKITTRQALAYE